MTFTTAFTVAGMGRQTFTGETFAELSAAWSAFRDSTGIGGSAVTSGGKVREGRKAVGHLSYNGKVWSSRDAWQTERPVFDPYAA